MGHAKEDCRLCRCHLKGATGDAMHAVLCAAGYNLRWLMRWITPLLLTILAVIGRGSILDARPAHPMTDTLYRAGGFRLNFGFFRGDYLTINGSDSSP